MFHHTKGRRLYLFGSGKYAKQFREKYDAVYPVSGYLDNDESRWGMEIDGLPVLAPRALLEMNPAEYKVIICIRNYLPVVKQLHRAGIPNYSVYDPRASYIDDRQTAVENDISRQVEQKKYNVGYIAGVFDLFHIGHLNLLMRAKAQCSHLIVGVVTDEGVIRHKNQVRRYRLASALPSCVRAVMWTKRLRYRSTRATRMRRTADIILMYSFREAITQETQSGWQRRHFYSGMGRIWCFSLHGRN